MLLYPSLTLLDPIGPQRVLSWYANIHLIWKTSTFSECPAELDVLFVPGGEGMVAVMKDRGVLAFLADRGARAKYVTSVCTGSIVLGAAGLLRGYRATSHWGAGDMLPWFGAERVQGRVVLDRNRMSGGGVTAGIDFGLILLAQLRGADAAKLTQLAMENDPQPPFEAGSPEGAGPELTEQLLNLFEPPNQQASAMVAGRELS